MRLSKFFSLEEFTRSDTARKLGISNEPTPEHVQNLSDMCVNLLDPIREAWGAPLIVSSGYRGYKLNAAVKGSKTSAHCFGLAADLVPVDARDIDEFKAFVPKFLKKSGLPYDQWIDETRKNEKAGGNVWTTEWGHIGYKDRKGRQRRQNLITTDGKTYHPLCEL